MNFRNASFYYCIQVQYVCLKFDLGLKYYYPEFNLNGF